MGSPLNRRVSRREFSRLASAAPLLLSREDCPEAPYAGGLTDIKGLQIGHDTLDGTGCTVVLAKDGAVAGVDVRGGAPGTRETDLLRPENSVQRVHAILLSGGSAFGLAAASGVMRYLEEKQVGFSTSHGPVPIVPAAILFDLGVGPKGVRPDSASGYRACAGASPGRVVEGNVGAGTGATSGKLFGVDRSTKTGMGSFSMQVADLRVAALVALNAWGDILDPSTDSIIAGARSEDGSSLVNSLKALQSGSGRLPARGHHTILAVVATNATFSQAENTRMAQMSQAGLARTVNPVHTPMDGDTVFALSTGQIRGADLTVAGSLCAVAVAEATLRAARTARAAYGLPAACDLTPLRR